VTCKGCKVQILYYCTLWH